VQKPRDVVAEEQNAGAKAAVQVVDVLDRDESG
jgi:hypothetical protein